MGLKLLPDNPQIRAQAMLGPLEQGAAAGIVAGPATNAVTAGATVAGVSRGVVLGVKALRLIEVSYRLLITCYFPLILLLLRHHISYTTLLGIAHH